MNHPNFIVQIDPSLFIWIDAHGVRSLQRRFPTICSLAWMRRPYGVTYNPKQTNIGRIGPGRYSSPYRETKQNIVNMMECVSSFILI